MRDTPTPDWIDLSPEPLDAARAIAHVADPDAGGVAVFLGTTRNETAPAPDNSIAGGPPLLALDYEAYPELALRQLHDLAARARGRWPMIRRLALLHRMGRVGPAEPSVVIAVATPHRGEAFDACRWLIDTLKTEVAVWKKEVWADGTGTWVNPG